MNPDSIEKPVNSRCQTFKFRRVPEATIAKHLFNIIERNGIEVPDTFIKEGLFLISEYAEGSVRQALQFLERCIYSELFREDQITEELGFISKDKIMELLLGLLRREKSFFNQLKKLQIREFFYYSFAVIVDVMKFKLTGYVDQDWKKTSYNMMTKEPNLEKLVEVYRKFSESHTAYGPAFNSKLFESWLVQYYLDTMAPPGVTQRSPVRKRTPATK